MMSPSARDDDGQVTDLHRVEMVEPSGTLLVPDAATRSPAAAEVVARDPGPLVSVVMPCYREPIPVLQRTLDSILVQSYSNFEIVVVVDDPENATVVRFMEESAEVDHRIRVVLNPRNLGVWPSYNRGVRESRGELIAIQDADDVSTPMRLEKLTEFLLAHPNVGVVGSALEYRDAATGRTLLKRTYPADAASGIRRFSPLAHGTTLRWACLDGTLGGYDESPAYRHAADYELWCRWHAGGVRMANVPETYYSYYQSDTNFKAQNVKAILRDTVRIKRLYARTLRFGVGDFLWLALEIMAIALPTRVIGPAFYAVSRWRSARLARAGAKRASAARWGASTRNF
jgi:glycosyltransferase involved in cell wall biosynthesis